MKKAQILKKLCSILQITLDDTDPFHKVPEKPTLISFDLLNQNLQEDTHFK